MAETFKVGDRVTWNSEAGQVSCTINKVYTHNVHSRGYTLLASEEDPRYEIKSGNTDETSLVKGSALRKQND